MCLFLIEGTGRITVLAQIGSYERPATHVSHTRARKPSTR
jgi:hypothetical protein